MKDFYIADAAGFENQPITSFFVIVAISARDRKGNGQYLALTLADKTGQFEARMWDDFAGVLDTCSAGCYVKAQGTVSKYQRKFQITLSKLRLAAAVEYDTADFIPTTQFDIPTMAAELRSYVAAFRNPHLRRLVLAFLDDPTLGPQFIEAPAAKRLHHAWLGGLLEHVLCLVRVCRATAPFYPEVDPDLLITGAILHDIGKVRELSWGSSFDYTLEGQLIGHISIAQGMLYQKIAQLDAEAAHHTTLSSQPESAPLPPPNLSSQPESAPYAPQNLSSRPESAPLAPQNLSSRPESAPYASPNLSSRPESAPYAPPNLSSRPESAPYADGAERPAALGGTSAAAEPTSLDSTGLQSGESVQEKNGASAPGTGPFPPQLRLLIEHMILSHHGKLEFGSPKLPMTPEAMLLSALDDLEAKFQTLRNEFAAARLAGRPVGETTEWVRSMERPLFDSQAWLATDKKDIQA